VTADTKIGKSETKPSSKALPEEVEDDDTQEQQNQKGDRGESKSALNLSYTINLNLPATTNPEVFNAIFKSLREHLLGQSK